MNLINERTLLGFENTESRKGFQWLCRYSDTNTIDQMGRWARICFYNGFQIAWINGFNRIHTLNNNSKPQKQSIEFVQVDLYSVILYFPTSGNDGGGAGHKIFNNLEEAKQYVEEIFLEFKQLINAEN